MKIITLIVPNKIVHALGTRTSSKSMGIEVNQEIIIKALECNDYHESYYFPKGSVRVESIEEI